MSFEEDVIAAILAIPRGEWMTYGEVAEAAGYPRAARAVGGLLRTSATDLPWWRVVGYDGRLKSPDPRRQARLLRQEGIRVVNRRVVQN
jgi:methylated-DNA-protein-cysteine methyltransferase-like protein